MNEFNNIFKRIAEKAVKQSIHVLLFIEWIREQFIYPWPSESDHWSLLFDKHKDKRKINPKKDLQLLYFIIYKMERAC